MSIETPTQRTKISPNQVFRLVSLLPQSLRVKFAEEAYKDTTPVTMEFNPEPERKYDHPLGLEWLTKHDIPNTVEDLEAQRQYVFQTMVSGPETYNVGQFIVLFPSVVYATRDIEDNLLVVEVMDELEFPPMPDLKVPYTDEMRKATWQDQSILALRTALQAYVTSGKIRIHTAGFRMYSSTDEYQFQERFVEEPTPAASFAESVRRKPR